jgi:hypothetical protein
MCRSTSRPANTSSTTWSGDRREGRGGRGRSDKGNHRDDRPRPSDFEPHASSPTDHVLTESAAPWPTCSMR